MTGVGISRLAVKKILPRRARCDGRVYDRHSYDPEKRTALEAWGRRLEAIVSGEKKPDGSGRHGPPRSQESAHNGSGTNSMTTVTLQFPDDVFSALRRSPEEFARELRVAAAIHWYERGELSQEKAAHVAGLSRAQFLMELARTKSDAFVVDFEDLKRELSLG